MAEYPTLTKKELAAFSGRPEQSYTKYSDQALLQATMLFKIGTCLAALPDNQTEQDLARLAILSMADSIFLSQAYQKAAASPFSSESIGSYSYSKAASAVSKGGTTGIMWFDLAVQQMSVCGSLGNGGSGIMGGGIFMDPREDSVSYAATNQPFYKDYLSPVERDASTGYGWDPNRVMSRN
jgi:hypothetical protein